MISKSRYQIAHAKSGITKLCYRFWVCQLVGRHDALHKHTRGTRVASYATRSTAMLVAGNTRVHCTVTRTRILLLVNTCTRDEQVCCAAAKACMKNIVLAQLSICYTQ